MTKVNFNELREAIEALNDSDLLEKKIKIVGVKKKDLIEDFLEAAESIEDDEEGNFAGPEVVAALYNKLVEPEEDAEGPKATGTMLPDEETEAVKGSEGKEEEVPTKGFVAKRNTPEVRAFISNLILEGKYDRKGIIKATVAEFPDRTETAIGTIISDAKNEKYCQLDQLVIVGENGKLRFVGK